ncbi:hypothetical protein V1502_11870 [Bacillus sp. SCS-153A]
MNVKFMIITRLQLFIIMKAVFHGTREALKENTMINSVIHC